MLISLDGVRRPDTRRQTYCRDWGLKPTRQISNEQFENGGIKVKISKNYKNAKTTVCIYEFVNEQNIIVIL